MSDELKIIIIILFIILVIVGIYLLKDDSIDYSNKDNWAYCEEYGKKDIDVFYIYPTLVDESSSKFATIEEMSENIETVYNSQTSVYEDYCNIYMPYYRQSTMETIKKIGNDYYAIMNFEKNNIPYYDIEKALDYYFKHYNKNKPFIIAGHSQGSLLLICLLTNYFQKHPKYLKRMIAAYAIGFAPSKLEMSKYSNFHFAYGETDYNSLISWNTEGPNAKGKTILLPNDSLVINPLNWKKDNTYASITQNKGSLKDNVIVKGLGDAQINLKRKTLVCNTVNDYIEPIGLFSTQSLHTSDYSLYYVNLKENIYKRIKNYKQNL